MKILRNNQIIVVVIALMLVAAGYLNYTSQIKTKETSASVEENTNNAGIGDAQLVNSGDLVSASNEINENIKNTTNNSITKETNAKAQEKDEYFSNSRLQRDTMYSQMIESYQKILENSSISETQKSISTQEIAKINTAKNAIMITENLIKTKGFEEGIVFVNDTSISVIIKKDKLEQNEIAQIQNIVSRELKAEASNIHISNK